VINRGTVRPDGTSTIAPPVGVYDMASIESVVSPEVEAKIAALMKNLDPRQTSAQFKLEVFFRAGARRSVPVRGIVSVFTNGGYLGGGGDASLYLCPQQLESGPCLAPIDVQLMSGRQAVCVKCRRVSLRAELAGQLIFDVPMQRWASIVVRLFHALDCNADLSICIERGSIHKAKELELTTHAGGEAYAKVVAAREWITYPLAHIIRDTSSGMGLETAFRAFLEA
jgi:hypothetical protein